jgi:hypothetical protein
MSDEPDWLDSVVETKQIPSVDRFPLRDIDADINEYLKLGWRIIDRWVLGNRSVESQQLYVLLGWTDAETEAPHPTLQQESLSDPF